MVKRGFTQMILVLACCQAAFAQTQLIQDGGFESPGIAPWILSGTGVNIGTGAGAFVGSQYLSMGNALGATGAAYQTVTFPSNMIAATLSLDLDVISSDTAGSDAFFVYITDLNNPPDILFNLGAASNVDPTSGYFPGSTNFIPYAGGDLVSPYSGQSVNVYFYVQTDPTYGNLTSFNVGYVSLLAATTANIPGNDNFTNALIIPGGGVTNLVNTSYASRESGEPYIAGNLGGHSVWYTWTAPAIGAVNITTAGSQFETLVGVYTGSSLTNLTVVSDSNGNGHPSGLAFLEFNATAGTTYQIALDGYNGASGSAEFILRYTQDTTPPKIAITSPAANSVVGSNSVVVNGTATDSFGVAFVEYSLKNASGSNAWQLATGTNSWTATVTNLLPGPNTVTVAAVDIAGNMSIPISRVFNYEISVPLALGTNGRGTITGATNGELLHLGFPYKITAKAAAGFAFAGWTGSISTNVAALSFVMESNLNLTANFVDAQKPTLSITAPKANERWSNSVLQITGTAADNVAVASVWFELNSEGWINPSTANNWATWSAPINLTLNANTLRAYAVDTSGNHSITNVVSFLYIASSRLQLATTGLGAIAPNDSNAVLQLGKTFTLTASAKTGYVFSSWVDASGAVVSDVPALTFVMQSNLFYTANFVPNPFGPAVGTYSGLFFQPGDLNPAGSGSFSALVNNNGTFTAKLLQGATSHSISGQFSPAGQWATNALSAWKNTAVWLTLNLTGENTLTGNLSNANWTAQIQSSRGVFSKTSPAPETGNYTLVLPTSDVAGAPAGDGYGSLSVSAVGLVTFVGVLGDGTKVNQSATISPQGQWPLYISLASGNGMVLGWLSFTNQTESDLSGPVQWVEPSGVAGSAYPAGFANQINAVGSAYSVPHGADVLNLTAGYVLLEDGGLAQSISNQFTLSANNKVTGADKLSLTFTAATGLFQGTTTNSLGKTVSFNGAVLQKQNAGFGQFLNLGQRGSVTIAPGSN